MQEICTKKSEKNEVINVENLANKFDFKPTTKKMKFMRRKK